VPLTRATRHFFGRNRSLWDASYAVVFKRIADPARQDHRDLASTIRGFIPASSTNTCGVTRAQKLLVPSAPMPPDSYLARLCWNSTNWVRPPGEAAKSEHGDTYNAEMGFGHEEWLFNYQWILDGWKYGFLQPVNRSLAKVQGKTLDVRLYTISPGRHWYYVGHLRSCEVLTEEAAEAARKEFKRRGWFKDMMSHLRQVGGNVAGLQYDDATRSVAGASFEGEARAGRESGRSGPDRTSSALRSSVAL